MFSEMPSTSGDTIDEGDDAPSNDPSGSRPPEKDPNGILQVANHSRKRKRPKIARLPQSVVDQIAAGEVVQRPVSVVKELLENSLDAGATQIVVQFDGLSKMSIVDNGRGIPKKDLALLCTRHATSKFASLDDFSDLSTFGFRGEALASTSMVSRLLTVVTRLRVGEYDDEDEKESGVAAFSQTYQNGKPMQKAPRPCARKVGTTITIEDLFYNVPHRQKAFSKRESEEYGKIHKLVQDYAVHYPTVGFVCQRRMATGGGRNKGSHHKQLVVDCNTGQIPAVKALLQSREMASEQHNKSAEWNKKIFEATKQILSHVLESNVAKHLLHTICSSSNPESSSTASRQDSDTKNEENLGAQTKEDLAARYKFRYKAEIYFTSPTYHTSTSQKSSQNRPASCKQGKFILFLNHRLVDLPPLKRALEDVYADLGKQRSKNMNADSSTFGKPVLVVNLHVPGSQVDVNVHPSKRQVALMYQEDLIGELVQKVRERLEEEGQAFVACSAATQPSTSTIRNPYAKLKNTKNAIDNVLKRKRSNKDLLQENDSRMDEDKDEEFETDTGEDGAGSQIESRKAKVNCTPSSQESSNSKASKTSSNTRVAPSKMIRTNAAYRAGAIEPFLVSTQPSSQSQSVQSENTADAASKTTQASSAVRIHISSCPLSKPVSSDSKVDMSQPGAFATILKQERCTCPTDDIDVSRRTIFVPSTIIRPKEVIPTPSKYTSIASLRKRVGKQQCHETTRKVRRAFYVGLMSNQRSLTQCGEELMMINHMEMAKELFYQLSLARFGGGAKIAQLGEEAQKSGLHIQTIVAQALECENEFVKLRERLAGSEDTKYEEEKIETNHEKFILSDELLKVSDSNQDLAQHVTARLVENAQMLEEYFSIRIEIQESSLDKDEGKNESNESRDNDNKHSGKDVFEVTGDAILTGLPVLLDGHSPQPHALPMFLLRLATQVDWTREKHCFHGVCRELGNFYAMLPTDNLNGFVQHNLFPALSYLLIPSKNLSKNGHFTAMTKLSTLYKAFERGS